MRQTCLTCGHQTDLPVQGPEAPHHCVCGVNFGHACLIAVGVQPSRRAADHLRARAFQAAGLVRNVGGFALMVALTGLFVFPLGLVGAALGLWTLVGLPSPLRRYSGRWAARWAILLGLSIFVVEAALCWVWLHAGYPVAIGKRG